MGYIITLIFLALATSLLLTLVTSKKFVRWVRLFRILTAVVSVAMFSYWFFERSVSRFAVNSMAVQLNNKLPQPIDFYIIKKETLKSEASSLITSHLGNIRPEHFRIEYLDMSNSDEYWIIGYLGKKNMVYFSQHAVPNKNIDQIVDVNNYINQSIKLSAVAGSKVDDLKSENGGTAIRATLSLLLLFLNIALVVRKK